MRYWIDFHVVKNNVVNFDFNNVNLSDINDTYNKLQLVF